MGNTLTQLFPDNSMESIRDVQPLTLPTDNNGFFLSGYYVPEEILVLILSHVEDRNLLELSLVCKRYFDFFCSFFIFCFFFFCFLFFLLFSFFSLLFSFFLFPFFFCFLFPFVFFIFSSVFFFSVIYFFQFSQKNTS